MANSKRKPREEGSRGAPKQIKMVDLQLSASEDSDGTSKGYQSAELLDRGQAEGQYDSTDDEHSVSSSSIEREQNSNLKWVKGMKSLVKHPMARFARKSYPVPFHNISTPLSNAERPYQFFGIVNLVNNGQHRLREMEQGLFPGKDSKPSREMLMKMQYFLQCFLKELVATAGQLPLVPESNMTGCKSNSDSIPSFTRDALTNLGVGFFLAGCYFILMGTDHEHGSQACMARYHLEKAFFKPEFGKCTLCGMRECGLTTMLGNCCRDKTHNQSPN